MLIKALASLTYARTANKHAFLGAHHSGLCCHDQKTLSERRAAASEFLIAFTQRNVNMPRLRHVMSNSIRGRSIYCLDIPEDDSTHILFDRNETNINTISL